jgi:hypothetical protein
MGSPSIIDVTVAAEGASAARNLGEVRVPSGRTPAHTSRPAAPLFGEPG